MTYSSPLYYEDETVDAWNSNERFSDPILAKIYERTKGSHDKEQQQKLTIQSTLILQCIPSCNQCKGYIITENSRRYKCSCIHHQLSDH